jgi:hypothetical protein
VTGLEDFAEVEGFDDAIEAWGERRETHPLGQGSGSRAVSRRSTTALGASDSWGMPAILTVPHPRLAQVFRAPGAPPLLYR